MIQRAETQQLHQNSFMSSLISSFPLQSSTSCSATTRPAPLLPLSPSLLNAHPPPLSFTSLFLSLANVSLVGEGPKLDSPLPSAPAALLRSRILQASGQNSPLASSFSTHGCFSLLFSFPFLNGLPYSFPFV